MFSGLLNMVQNSCWIWLRSWKSFSVILIDSDSLTETCYQMLVFWNLQLFVWKWLPFATILWHAIINPICHRINRICPPLQLSTLLIIVFFALETSFLLLFWRSYSIFGKKGIWNFLKEPRSGPLKIPLISIFLEIGPTWPPIS